MPTDGAVERIALVVLTPRFGEALAFYRDALGMRVLEEWFEFGHGALLEAAPRGLVELIDSPDSASVPAQDRTTFIGLEVPDVDAVHRQVIAAGGRIKGPPVAKPWGGRGFTAFDPDGMPVNVYTAYDDAG